MRRRGRRAPARWRPWRRRGSFVRGSFVLLADDVGGFCVEDFFDALAKKVGEFEREREAGRVFSGLERNDGLPRDAGAIGELGLRPVVFSTQNAQAILHRYL